MPAYSEMFLFIERANFFGSKFTILDPQRPHTGIKVTKSSSARVGLRQISPRELVGSYSVGQISYDLNVLGARGPRKMRCIFDSIPASAIEPGGVAPTQTEFPIRHLDHSPSIRFGRSKSSSMKPSHANSQNGGALVLKSKPPRWHDQLQCWCLNFHGRVTIASVKNFQLVAASKPEPLTPSTTTTADKEPIIIQFGKVGKDLFTMDYRYPVSAFQAFAVCLSSFASNVSCE